MMVTIMMTPSPPDLNKPFSSLAMSTSLVLIKRLDLNVDEFLAKIVKFLLYLYMLKDLWLNVNES